jgi:CheY-like chemotaxis protein
MPGMSGLEVVERLPRGHHPRIVFLTSAAAQDVGSALLSGPHYYLPKGASRDQLSLLLQSLGE